jgi:hypothetical protein
MSQIWRLSEPNEELRPMHKRFALALVFVLTGTAAVLACGPRTVALIEAVAEMERPPMFRCGSEFNEMLARAQKKDWKGALAAYEAHLSGMGKWEADSANARATLDFLRKKAETQ